MAQRHHRIRACRAKRRDVTGEQSDTGKDQRHDQEDRKVERTNLIAQCPERSDAEERDRQTDCSADTQQFRGMADYHFQHIGTLCSKRHADADFVGALNNEK